jgi:hypothetical protein
LLVSCRSATPVPSVPTEPGPVTEIEQPGRQPPDAPEPTSTAGDSRPPPELAESFGGDVPHECWGSTVHLAEIEPCRCRLPLRTLAPGYASNQNSCSERFYDADLRNAVRVELLAEPSDVESGATVRLVVVLTNETSGPLGLVFRARPRHSQSAYPGFVRVFDARGRDRTTAGITAATTGGNGDYLVLLAPRGQARYPITWQAVTVTGTAGANGTRFEPIPLPAGSYRLAFPLDFDHSLQVSEEQRLPSTVITVTASP